MEPKTAESSAAADESLRILISGLDDEPPSSVTFRDALATASANLAARFRTGESVVALVHVRSQLIDELLVRLWRETAGGMADTAALVAVGGYGRGELHPFSDIDVMVLLPDAMQGDDEANVGEFLTALWDLGLDIGHSIRTVEDCGRSAADDITIATTLMEARLLDGDAALFARMETAVAPGRIWPSDRFFEEKRREQQARHRRYDDTAYKLEPNVKGSPGGLRDIQMIGWVAKRHFGGRTLDELVAHEFLTPGQLDKLKSCQEFLWRVRFGLHILTGRREDRLLFDHQARLHRVDAGDQQPGRAARLGLHDAEPAAPEGPQRLVVAQRGEREPRAPGRLQHGHPLGGLDVLPVDLQQDIAHFLLLFR